MDDYKQVNCQDDVNPLEELEDHTESQKNGIIINLN